MTSACTQHAKHAVHMQPTSHNYLLPPSTSLQSAMPPRHVFHITKPTPAPLAAICYSLTTNSLATRITHLPLSTTEALHICTALILCSPCTTPAGAVEGVRGVGVEPRLTPCTLGHALCLP
jgi:hypothetical protein